MNERSKGVLNRLMERGEEVFTQVSNELMMNPRFIQAMQSAMRGKETMDFAVTQALKTMNVPTRQEFKRVATRVDALENELRELRDELRRTRAQAARASVAARTSTRAASAPAATGTTGAKKKSGARKAASRAASSGKGGSARKGTARGAARTRVTATSEPSTPVTVHEGGKRSE